jgi:hypothetical protein
MGFQDMGSTFGWNFTSGINEELSTYDDEDSESPGVVGCGVLYSVELSPLHGMTWYSSTSAASSFSSAALELMISRSPASSPC